MSSGREKGSKGSTTRDVVLSVDTPTDEVGSEVRAAQESRVPSTVDATEPGFEQPFSSPLAGEEMEDLASAIERSRVGADASIVDLDASALSEVEVEPDPERAERHRAIAIGLVLGVVIGLVIVGFLSNALVWY